LLDLVQFHSLAIDFVPPFLIAIIRSLISPSVQQFVEGGQLESIRLERLAVVVLEVGDAGFGVTFLKSTVISFPIKGKDFHVVGIISQLLHTFYSKVAAGQLIQVFGLVCIEDDEVAVEHAIAVVIFLPAVADVCDHRSLVGVTTFVDVGLAADSEACDIGSMKWELSCSSWILGWLWTLLFTRSHRLAIPLFMRIHVVSNWITPSDTVLTFFDHILVDPL